MSKKEEPQIINEEILKDGYKNLEIALNEMTKNAELIRSQFHQAQSEILRIQRDFQLQWQNNLLRLCDAMGECMPEEKK